jgi:hypothetical protein
MQRELPGLNRTRGPSTKSRTDPIFFSEKEKCLTDRAVPTIAGRTVIHDLIKKRIEARPETVREAHRPGTDLILNDRTKNTDSRN